jgi:Fe-S-cluster containining protein
MSDSSGVGSCLGCTGYCCTVYMVPVVGYDVWRIVHSQRLSPVLFVQCDPEDTPTDTGFLLQAPGPTYGLSLRHTPLPHARRPCVFLVHLRDGVYRCGIYNDRPLVCQTYPMRIREGDVFVRSDALCPPGSWANLERGQAPWRERLQRRQAEWQRYGEVVTCWNTMVRASDPQQGFELDAYLSFLVNAYDYGNEIPTDEVAARLTLLAESFAHAPVN